MAPTFSQICLTIFCKTVQNFVHFLPYNSIQISPAYCPNTYKIMYGEILDFRCQRQYNGNINCPVEKSNFCRKFAIKNFPCYRSKCLHWKSEVSPHIICYVLGPHAGEIWTTSYCPKNTRFWAFWQKIEFLKTIFNKSIDAILKDVSDAETCLMVNY